MSVQPQFILVVNQDKIEEIKKILPDVLFAHVFPHEIGSDTAVGLASVKQVPPSEEIPMPEALERAIEDAIEVPVEDLDLVPAE